MYLSTRVHAIAGIALTVLALGVCSSSQPAPASSPEASATSETSATCTITDVSGQEATLPSYPSCVVTLPESTTDNASVPGVTPIGVVSGHGWQTILNYLVERAGDIPTLGSIDTPSLGATGMAHLDLILVDGTSVKNNDTETLIALARTAPVFFMTQKGGGWRETFTLTADALGVADQAEAKPAKFDQHVASVSACLKDVGYLDQTYPVARWQGDSAGLILKELPAGQALTAPGMRRPANQDRDSEGHSELVSLENIDQIDADWIFFGMLSKASVDNPFVGGDTGVEVSAVALEETKTIVGFDSLGAVKANHVTPIDGSLWASTGGYLFMDGIVSSIEAQFVPVS